MPEHLIVLQLFFLQCINLVSINLFSLQAELDEKARILVQELFKVPNLATNEELLGRIKNIPFMCANRVNSKYVWLVNQLEKLYISAMPTRQLLYQIVRSIMSLCGSALLYVLGLIIDDLFSVFFRYHEFCSQFGFDENEVQFISFNNSLTFSKVI